MGIVFTSLSKNYKIDSSRRNVIFSNLSGRFPDKGLVLIYGPSGCGKTTFLSILCGIDKDFTGKIVVNGKDINKIKKSELFTNYYSIIFQNKNFITNLTVKENIDLIFAIKGINEYSSSFVCKLKEFGLYEKLNNKIETLSGGQLQILCLLICSCSKANIIICDEPTGSIDAETEERMVKMFKSISKEKLVIIVSHNVNLYKEYADYLFKMEKSK